MSIIRIMLQRIVVLGHRFPVDWFLELLACYFQQMVCKVANIIAMKAIDSIPTDLQLVHSVGR